MTNNGRYTIKANKTKQKERKKKKRITKECS